MFKAPVDHSQFRLRPASPAAERGASSLLRVARTTARAAPVLQPQRTPRQLSFDFMRGGR